MERGCALCFLVVLTASYLVDGQEVSCPQGKFGDSCSYSCNCPASCNRTTGVCSGGCDVGWREGNGTLCQKRNIAYRKTVSGSGDYTPVWTAEKAVDGNRDQDVNHNSCYHSLKYPTFWWVDLAAEYRIHSVRIYNRAGYPHRLANCRISVGTKSDANTVCYTFPSNPKNITDVVDLTCNGIGKFFIIRNPDRAPKQDDTLNICEVEIYVCSYGTFGPNCSEFCHCLNSTCNHVTGLCPGDCRSGWKGDNCSTRCSDESYGINCKQSCKNRKCTSDKSSCDRRSGSCDTGCRAGWRQSDCTQECDSSYYGINCSSACADRRCALNTSLCNHVTGSCDTGVCQAGWKGTACTEKCDSKSYGPNCLKQCSDRHCNGNSTCPAVNGSCAGGCDKGWRAPDCSECTTGFHGPECIDCGHCAANGTCDFRTGECPSGCLEGFIGLQCKESEGNGSTVVGGVVGTLLLLLLAFIIAVIVLRCRRKHLRSSRGQDAAFTPKERQRGGDNVYMNVEADTFPIYATPNKAYKEDSGSVDNIDVDTRSIDTLDVDSRSVDTLEIESDEEGREPDVPKKNYYNMDEVASRHAVPVADLETTTKNMDDNPELVEEEFKRLPDGLVHSYDESRKPENTKKNRFKGYYPYDNNRVVLHDDSDGKRGDYINASFLDGYKKERYYIAAQGPYKPNIVDDFWRMIWQEGCKVVVMVTSLVEGGRMKCLQYWPDEGTQEYGDIIVTMETVNQLSDFTIRKLRVDNHKESTKRQIYHFNFTSWPDHGVPSTFSLLDFMWRVKAVCERPAEPVIVHCSAGIGRTGTYIAIESLLDQATAEDTVDVVRFVSSMRGQRRNMIQTSDQYGFVYRAVTAALMTGDTSVDGDAIRSIDLANMGAVTMGNRTVEEHLQALETVPVKTKKKRIVLIPSYRCRYGFFLFVADVDKENLWAHVCNSNSCTVITLGQSNKGLMPTGNEPVATTRQTATLKSSSIIADDIKLDTINSNIKDSSVVPVRHYRLKTGVHSPNAGIMIDSLLQWTFDPDRRRCTIISKSVSEARLLVLLVNIASRLKDDGRVDVINNMRRLYREVGQTYFTEADVKFALKFAQLQMENFGIYANL
ncbi:uncharacterized protein [Haliotis cracherodii]|uniref:uncharacterized protein n=1 Tax=Haliotis cracherodii TaxID=6455 RepID=UPI0039ED38A6